MDGRVREFGLEDEFGLRRLGGEFGLEARAGDEATVDLPRRRTFGPSGVKIYSLEAPRGMAIFALVV